jgi:hypothetical protein
MYVGDIVGSKIYELVPIVRNQSLKAVGDSQYTRNAVSIVGLHDDRPNDVVEAGTKPSAGDDCTAGVFGLKKNLSARACRLEAKRLSAALERGSNCA